MFGNVRGGNYGSVGQQINKQNQTLNAVNMEASPDYGQIAEEAIKGRSKERRAAIQAEASIHKTGLKEKAQQNLYTQDAELQKDLVNIKKPAKRMAGIVGAAGTIAGGFVLKKFDDEAKVRDEKWEKRFKDRMTQTEELLSTPGIKPPAIEKPPMQEKPTYGTLEDSGNTKDSGGGSSKVTTYQSMPLAGSSDISKLTDDDFKHLAYAISSEAGPGKDKYGVAAAILNRVASEDWPGTVKDVIFQGGQFEGVYEGRSTWRPDIAADLSSETGRSEILKALGTLDGRTDFKGQTQLHNRSGKGNKGGMLDPMFDPKGNFFHYSWQG